MRRILCLGVFSLSAFSAHASYYAVFNGLYEIQPNTKYAGAYTNNGLGAPAGATSGMGIRLGNEAGLGAIRLAITINDVFNLKESGAAGYGETSWSRWGGLLQVNISPASFLSLTAGAEVGMGFTKLLIMTNSANGVMYEKHGYATPVLGIEARLSQDFRFFAEASYPMPFSIRSEVHGDSLGVGPVALSHLVVSSGLSFYFSL